MSDAPNTRISIITVTYNSAATVAETVRSVLSQTFSPLEYIVMDGASGDDTVSIVEGYRKEFEDKGIRLTVISEPDNGMYDAMNKGIRISSGDVIGIINSDDWYEPDALKTVANEYSSQPFDLFYADLRLVFPGGRSFVKHSRYRRYATSRDWNHPTTFIAKTVYDHDLYRTETIHDDYDLILRIRKQNIRIRVVNKVLANFRMNGVSHSRSVSAAIKSIKLKYRIYRQNGYSRLYIIEPLMEEVGKLIIG